MTQTDCLSLRRAGPGDRDLLLEWRNDPQTVATSFSRRPVTSEEHARWFAARLSDPDCVILVVEQCGQPIGQVRLERLDPERVALPIGLAPEARGRGLGSKALRSAFEQVTTYFPDARILVGRVRADNEVSLRLFARAGFRTVTEGEVMWMERPVPR